MNVSRSMQRVQVLLLCALLASVWANAQSTITVQVQFAPAPGSLWPGLQRPIPPTILAAILSSRTFDARAVDTRSLILIAKDAKPLGTRASSPCKETDVNRDGLLDLLCVIRTTSSTIEPGREPVALEGRTLAGKRIRGEFLLQASPNQ